MGAARSGDEDSLKDATNLLYVGMTRAQKNLILTTSKDNELSRRVLATANQMDEVKEQR